MSGSFALEKPLRIAYLGPEGTFSHAAAAAKFGSSVEYVPLSDIPAVFEEVVRGHADYGLAPVENSIGGGIVDTLDAFLNAASMGRYYRANIEGAGGSGPYACSPHGLQ